MLLLDNEAHNPEEPEILHQDNFEPAFDMQESEHHQEEILVSEQVEVEENPPSREVQDTMSDKHNPQPRQMRQHQQNSRRSNNTGGASSGSNQRR